MKEEIFGSARGYRELRLEFEELLTFEAALFDENRLEEWLELLDDEIRYRVPARSDQDRGAEDFERPGLLCHIDDDKRTLMMRAKRAHSIPGFSDDPPSRVRHLVANVRIVRAQAEVADVNSSFIIFRSHVGLPDHLLTGARRDRWVKNGHSWKLRNRLIILDQTILHGLAVLI